MGTMLGCIIQGAGSCPQNRCACGVLYFWEEKLIGIVVYDSMA